MAAEDGRLQIHCVLAIYTLSCHVYTEPTMAIHIRDPETDRLARELARLQGSGITEAVKSALEAKLAEERRKVPLMERIKDLTDRIEAAPETGLEADKAFYDWLSGEDDE